MRDISCKILFENNRKPVYYAGEVCSGTVNLTFNKEKSIRDRNNVVIQPGQYILPFACRLPINLPSTIKTEHGYIRYKVTLVIDRHYLWPNNTYFNEFRVFKQMNLNDFRMHRRPVIKQIQEDFGSIFCCYSNNAVMIIAIRLAPSAYIPGEKINITIETTNNSNASIINFRIKLIQVVRFQKNSNSSKYSVGNTTIVETLVEGCNNQENRITEVRIPLELMQPTDLTCSSICNISYKLKIKAIINRLFCNLSVEFPITIGTLPFSTLDASQMNSGAESSSIVDSHPAINLPPSAPPVYFNNSTTAFASSSNNFYDDTATTSTAVYGLSSKTLTQKDDNLFDPPTYDEATNAHYPLN